MSATGQLGSHLEILKFMDSDTTSQFKPCAMMRVEIVDQDQPSVIGSHLVEVRARKRLASLAGSFILSDSRDLTK